MAQASLPSLRITEIFHSLQGESRTVGRPTTFVRLTGCPMRCVYCDTAYAFSGGEQLELDAILERVDSLGASYVTVTGGEPLAQANCWPLLEQLCDRGYEVSLETGGAVSIAGVDPRVSIVLDIKTPASGEVAANVWENIKLLKLNDQVKFVLCDKADYAWARLKLDEYQLASKVSDVLFSPSFGQLDPTELAAWVLNDKLPVRLQLQVHKLLWGDEQGR